MIRAHLVAVVDHDLETGVAGVPRHPRGFLMVKAARTHTDCKPGTNPTALWIEVLRGAPGLQEDIVEEIFRFSPLADDADRQTEQEGPVTRI